MPRTFLVFGACLLVGCDAGSSRPNPTSPAPTAVLTAAATRVDLAPTVAASPAQAIAPAPLPTKLTFPPASPVQPTAMAALPTELPLTPEQNLVGDIPDSQAFVKYQSAVGGYALDAPEGWARTAAGGDVSFVDKFNGVKVALTQTATSPTAATARGREAEAIAAAGRAVKIGNVRDVQLPGGPAVLIEYTANSDPNPVTGKQVRLDLASYLFFSKGRLATLTLWAPLGADNVDQWLQIARSFRWL